MKTIAFKTLGCKVNQYETQAIREQFINAGFKEAPRGDPADVYIINTCTVTSKSDAESRRLIRNALKENPGSKVIVTGCYAEMDEDELYKISSNLVVMKNSEKPAAITRFEGRTKAFVKIQDGCDNFCSYCKVPLARGRSRSRSPEEIIGEISALVSNGYKEIILCGICLGDWGRGLGLKLAWLLEEIENKVNGQYRVRLSSIEPWYVTPELLKKIADSNKICRHLHIPMQSGDGEILEKMNRKFSANEFMNLIDRLRLLMPEAAFTTDVLVGFPGEEERQFNNTLKLVKLTRPSRTHIFPFSMRKGTQIFLSGASPVPAPVVKNRINEIRAVTDKLTAEYKTQFSGKSVNVLVETQRDRKTGLLSGFTDTYLKVTFPGSDELKGQLAAIMLDRQMP